MYKSLLKSIGGILLLMGGVMLLPAIVAVIYQEWYALAGFGISAVFTGAIGYLLYKVLFKKTEDLDRKFAMLTAAWGWLSIAVLGSIPFLITAHLTPDSFLDSFLPQGSDYTASLVYFRNPLHALFESMSGYTTTGLTMAVHEPSIGKTLLFYRSLSQWFGGAGFIVMVLAVLHQPGKGSLLLYSSEARSDKLKTSVVATASAIWKLYLGISLFLFLYLLAGTLILLPDYPLGDTFFDAINHAMASQSSGGFSTLDNSIGSYESSRMEMLYILPMIVGSISMAFYFKLFYKRKLSAFWNDLQTRWLLISFLSGAATLSWFLMQEESLSDPWVKGIFQFVSALSTTGWQTSDVNQWGPLPVLVMLTAMIIGAGSGSSAGGIKMTRLLLIVRGLIWELKKPFISKNTIKTIHYNHQIKLPDEMNALLSQATLLTLFYLLMILVSSGITSYFMGDGYSPSKAFFEAASAQGTVGLSTGITGPDMPAAVEVTYIFQMWTGRLEVIPVLVMLRALFFGYD